MGNEIELTISYYIRKKISVMGTPMYGFIDFKFPL